MSQILSIFMFIVMGIAGGLSSIYLTIALPAVIIWKIFRKNKYGYKITD